MNLEEALKLACQKGMTHLTLYPVPSADNKTTYWCARATPSTGHSYVQIATHDPVEAVLEVLRALPSAKRRKTHAENADPARDPNLYGSAAAAELTATVTEPETPPQPETLDTWLPKM